MAKHEISCDRNKDFLSSPPNVKVRIGDADSQTLIAHLYDDGIPYTPKGELLIQIKRKNGAPKRSDPMTGSGNVWTGTIPVPSYLDHGIDELGYIAEYVDGKAAGTFSDIKFTTLPGTTDESDVATADERLNELVTKYSGSGGEMDLAERARAEAERRREAYFAQLKADVDAGEYDGATFTPSVSDDGTLSWTNDAERPNPKSVNLMGPEGPRGLTGEQGPRGDKGETGDAAGFGEVTATVDQSTGEPSVDVTADGPDTAKAFHFDFHSIKGERGEAGPTGERGPQGDVGEPAGFGEIRATVDQSTGEASVTVETDGPDTAKTFTFGFTGIKGEVGERGPEGPRGLTGETGPEGPKGDTGDPGPKGDVGEGLKLLGVYESEEALREAVPRGERVGDAYMGGESYFVWDGTDWRDAGHLQGAKGDRGEPGPTGPQGPDGPTGPAGRDGAFSEVTVTTDGTHLDQPTAEAVLGGEPGAQTLAISFTGLMGPQGEQGADGEPGKEGPAGPAGEDGRDGQPGKDANIAGATATVDATHLDEPTVTVEVGGEPGAQTLGFDFRGLAGKDGENATTTEVASVEADGLMPRLSGDSQQVMRGDGTWGEGGGKGAEFTTDGEVEALIPWVDGEPLMFEVGITGGGFGDPEATLRNTSGSDIYSYSVSLKYIDFYQKEESYTDIATDPARYEGQAVTYGSGAVESGWSEGESQTFTFEGVDHDMYWAYMALYIYKDSELVQIDVQSGGDHACFDMRPRPVPDEEKCLTTDQLVHLLNAAIQVAIKSAVGQCIKADPSYGEYILMADGSHRGSYDLIGGNVDYIRNIVGVATTEQNGLMPQLPESPEAE